MVDNCVVLDHPPFSEGWELNCHRYCIFWAGSIEHWILLDCIPKMDQNGWTPASLQYGSAPLKSNDCNRAMCFIDPLVNQSCHHCFPVSLSTGALGQGDCTHHGDLECSHLRVAPCSGWWARPLEGAATEDGVLSCHSKSTSCSAVENDHFPWQYVYKILIRIYNTHTHIHIYIYIHIFMHLYIHIYIYNAVRWSCQRVPQLETMARNWTWRWVDWYLRIPIHWDIETQGYEVQSQSQCVKKAPHHLQIRWFVLIDLLWDFGLVHLELLLFKRPTYKWRFPKIGAPPNHPF